MAPKPYRRIAGPRAIAGGRACGAPLIGLRAQGDTMTMPGSTSGNSGAQLRARPSRAPAAYSEFKEDRQFATTLARGLELLRCFSPDKPMLSNREISRLLDLPAPTVSRLAYTLTRMGYLTQDAAYGKYRLGSAVLSLGYPMIELFSTTRQRARPLMEALAQQTGGSISIGIRDRLGMVLIEAVRSHRPTAHAVDIGTTHSLAGTALGRAYMAAMNSDDRQTILNLLRIKAADEWARYGAKLLDNLARYPDRGYCTSLGEVQQDVYSIAVPLGRIDRKEAAAITCSFHGRAPDEHYLLEEIGPKLLSLARRLA